MNWKPAILILVSSLALAATVPVRAGDVEVSARLEPEEISLGEATLLTLIVQGSASVTEPQFPNIDSLQITRVGKSTNIQFINGVMSGGVTYTYQVVPEKTGVFTIPELSIRAGREIVKTAPITLRVAKPYTGTPGTSSQAPTTQSPDAPSLPPPPSPSTTTQAPAEVASEPVVFQISLPKRDFYVGELVPAELKVYLRQGLNILEVFTPTLSGNAFTIGKLSTQPDTAEDAYIDGKLYKILTWHSTVAPVKSGEYPLNVQMDVLVTEQVRRRSPFGDAFPDDPFFDRFFMGEQRKRVTLKSKDTQVKTLSIPEEGRPADFSGAIGQFEFATDATPREIAAGDPITLKMSVAGAGNFDRVKAPELDKTLGFRTYTPSAKFEPFDSAGVGGRKIFEQMVIPQNSSIKGIPRITFSYFDPDKGKYATLASKEIPLKVVGGTPSSAGASTTPPPASTPSQPPAGFTASDSEVVPNKLVQGSVSSTLEPLLVQPWFLALQLVPMAALIAASVHFRRRDRLTSDPAFARSVSASRAIQVQLGAMDKALQQKNSHDFFMAARGAIRERLGERLGIKPETITLADLSDWGKRLNHGSEASIQEIKGIFDVADAMAYSGQKYSAESLNDWKQKVLQALKRLEKIS